jgi:AraC-like DNA-binding protein
VYLPWPKDERARRILERVRDDPAQPLDLAGTGLSLRTLQRIVARETGLTLGRHVRQLQLLAGLERVANGMKVTSAAFECGYESPSAFIAAFKATFGRTPARYFEPSTSAERTERDVTRR